MWDGDGDDAIAGAAAGDAVEAPGGGEGDEGSGVEMAMRLKVNGGHVERNVRGRVALSVDVGLVAGNVGVVDDSRIVNDGVEHGRGGEVGGVGLGHGERRLGRGDGAVFAEVNPLGEVKALLHRFGEFLCHGFKREGKETLSSFLLKPPSFRFPFPTNFNISHQPSKIDAPSYNNGHHPRGSLLFP